MKTTHPSGIIDERNWFALGDRLTAYRVEGAIFLTRGKSYIAVSEVIDNKVSVEDDSGEVLEYLASHFIGYTRQPLPRPTGNKRKWMKVTAFVLSEVDAARTGELVEECIRHNHAMVISGLKRVNATIVNDITNP